MTPTPALEAEEKAMDPIRAFVERLAVSACEPPEHGFDVEPPIWAQDSFNSDCASQCGYCGCWMGVVRPGKVQCEWCGDGRDIAVLAKAAMDASTSAMTQQNPASPDGELGQWFALPCSLKQGPCATEACLGGPAWRFEGGGVGSNYCPNCHAKLIIDAAVSRCYRRFKDWSNRKFNADDVTWCEVRADLVEIATALASAPRPDADAKLVEGVVKELNRLATWLDVAETKFGGLGDNVSLRQAWEAMRRGASSLLSITERAASLEKTASEALQECERLRAGIVCLIAQAASAKEDERRREAKYAWLRSEAVVRGAFEFASKIDDAYEQFRALSNPKPEE